MFISILLGGGVPQPEPKCHLDLKSNFIIFFRGGVHQPEPKCHLDLKSNFIILGRRGVHQPEPQSNFIILGWGVHQPEPKCHIDLRFQLFHYWGGVHRKFALICFNFSNPEGGYIRGYSILLQLFQFLGGYICR